MRKKTTEIVMISLFAALTAVGAFIRIPIPYVPFTLQTLMVMLAGLILGSRLAALSQLLYLAIGLLMVLKWPQLCWKLMLPKSIKSVSKYLMYTLK